MSMNCEVGLQVSCPVLPDPDRIVNLTADRIENSVKRTLQKLMPARTLSNEMVKLMEPLSPNATNAMVSNLLFDFMGSMNNDAFPIAERKWTDLERKQFAILVKTFPLAAKQADEKGNMLLPMLLSHAHLEKEIIMMLIVAYPSACTMYHGAHDDYQGVTPLHQLFMRDDVEPELILFMLLHCPNAARQDMGGKYPLHLAMELLQSSPDNTIVVHILKTLLNAYPEAAFKEIEEEKRVFRWTPLSQEAVGGEVQFIAHVVKSRWTPLEKAMASTNEVKGLFSRFIHCLGKRKLQSEVRK